MKHVYYVTVLDGGAEICVAVDASNKEQARNEARKLHPHGHIVHVEVTREVAPSTDMERVANVAARIRGESVPDWQRRGFLRAEKPTNDEHSFGL